MPAHAERRLQPRAALEGDAVALFGQRSVKCRLLDVSPAGVRLLAPGPGPVGQHFQVRFTIPAAQGRVDIAPDAVLARCGTLRGQHIWGVHFLHLDPSTEAVIGEYIAASPPKPPTRPPSRGMQRRDTPRRDTERPGPSPVAGRRVSTLESPHPVAVEQRLRVGTQGERAKAVREILDAKRDPDAGRRKMVDAGPGPSTRMTPEMAALYKAALEDVRDDPKGKKKKKKK